MKKNRLYWSCQVGGWLFFTGIEMVSYLLITEYTPGLVYNALANFVLGIALTHSYRLFLIRMNWLSLPISSLIPRATVCVLIISLVLSAFNIWLDKQTVSGFEQMELKPIVLFFYWFNLSKYILLWAVIYHLFQYWEKSLKVERDKFALEATLKETQYNSLKTQLNPHFLFNSLNSIRTLIDLNPILSKEAITRLSNLLRGSLQMGKNKTVSLREELETVKDYLAIEKIRFDDRLSVQLNAPENTLDCELPPMMIQTLVENCIKHGINNLKQGGRITLDAACHNGSLMIELRNTGQMKPNGNENGLGIANTRERLRLLYDERALFTIINENDNTVLTQLSIPLS